MHFNWPWPNVSSFSRQRDAVAGEGCNFTTEGIVKLGDAEQMDGWTFWSFVGSAMKRRWTLRTIGRFGPNGRVSQRRKQKRQPAWVGVLL